MPVFPKRTACIAASALLSVSAFAADCVNGVNPTGNCTVPTGVTSITIEAWGGGGGGSGSFFGGGGGGGSYCKATFAVVPGAQLTVAVGMGGAGGGHGVSGTPGTPSSVMGTGVAGMQANAGSGGTTDNAGSAGGAGGDTDACMAARAVKWLGGHGADGVPPDGGGGGGSATALGAGGNGSGATGGTGEGAGGNGSTGVNNGAPGQVPGGGGGGGGFDMDGGDGAAGRVKMTFAAAPVVAANSVPTVSAGGLMGLSALLAIFGMARARRRQG